MPDGATKLLLRLLYDKLRPYQQIEDLAFIAAHRVLREADKQAFEMQDPECACSVRLILHSTRSGFAAFPRPFPSTSFIGSHLTDQTQQQPKAACSQHTLIRRQVLLVRQSQCHIESIEIMGS